ncbi:MAG: hypothetical protein HC836_16565 [Richelia sp. RM2_1_2]|nr:hypothetical protein [Richelia sp. RM2_1_2]
MKIFQDQANEVASNLCWLDSPTTLVKSYTSIDIFTEEYLKKRGWRNGYLIMLPPDVDWGWGSPPDPTVSIVETAEHYKTI